MSAPTQKLPLLYTPEERIAVLSEKAAKLQEIATASFRRGDVPAGEFYNSAAWSVQRTIRAIEKEAS